MEVEDVLEIPLKSVFDGSEYTLIATTVFKVNNNFKSMCGESLVVDG